MCRIQATEHYADEAEIHLLHHPLPRKTPISFLVECVVSGNQIVRWLHNLLPVTFLRAIDGFFFNRISAKGFGLMRIAWAFFTGAFLLMQWKDVTFFYADSGLVTPRMMDLYIRSSNHFTILDWVNQPLAVFCLYLILLIVLFCMMIGFKAKWMTIASVLLLFSFHERNGFILGGGDTLLRDIGFILMIAPNISAFSLDRLQLQWQQWKKTRTFLPGPTISVWPQRMLLWQMIALYATSLWYKLLGDMWINGTAVEATLHHPIYARWTTGFINHLMPLVGTADYLALFWQGAWLLLLIPKWFTDLLPPQLPRIPLRRILIIGGIFFHGGILLFMDAGVFSLAVWTAYLGLLRDEDFSWLKRVTTKVAGFWLLVFGDAPATGKPIIVFFDGRCGLCTRSIFTLQMFDGLKHLSYVDFRDPKARASVAPQLSENELDKSMHILLPATKNQQPKTLKGFDAFRRITWHLSALWIAAPLLYIPGIPFIGRRIYAKIAANRRKCDHEGCAI